MFPFSGLSDIVFINQHAFYCKVASRSGNQREMKFSEEAANMQFIGENWGAEKKLHNFTMNEKKIVTKK